MKKVVLTLALFVVALPLLKAANEPANPQVPAYQTEKEANKPLAATLSHTNFNDPQAVRAYKIAKEIPKVLAQQPCYCWCSRGGHKSLHDCYVSDHAANCGVCMKEAFLSYKMTKAGKSPAQIREAIERGEWANAN